MKHFKLYVKMALKPRAKNIICILSLALGLALSLVLFGNVIYEKSFDNFHDKGDRIYLLKAHYIDTKVTGEDTGDVIGNQVPDIVTTAIYDEIPEVELASKYRGKSFKYTIDNNAFFLNGLEVDSMFFDIFSFDVLQGEPREDFKDGNTIYLSQSKANELFGNANPVGMMINRDKKVLTVRGVFKDFPENTVLKFQGVDFIESMAKYRIREGWFGGDSKAGVVLLRAGATELDVEKKIQNLLDANVDPASAIANNMVVQYKLLPLADEHANSPTVKQMTLLISFVALLLIIVSALNNSLISLSAMSSRLKEIAIHKCNGASSKRVVGIIFGETAVQTFVALVLSVMLIFAFENQIATYIAPIEVIFTLENIWGAVLVVALMLLVSSVIPCMVFSRIPVISLFRKSKNSNQLWKKIMLFFQLFFAISFISISFITLRQYSHMLNKDLGYNYENLVFETIEINGIDDVEKYQNDLTSLNCVEGVSFGSSLVTHGLSGSGIMEGDNMLFSARNLESSEEIFETHEIKFIEGETFRNEGGFSDVVVNEKFIEMMNWNKEESAVGKRFESDGGNCVIVGVVNNFEVTGDILATDYSPVLIRNLYAMQREYADYIKFPINVMLTVKLTETSAENIDKVRSTLAGLNPLAEDNITHYRAYRAVLLDEFKKIANVIEVASLIILLISAMGLFGYIGNELQFKHREIALRKVYGATIPNVILMTYNPIMNILFIAIPLGVVVSYFGGDLLLQNFPDAISLSWWIFVLSVLFVVGFTLLIVIARTFKVASENPVKAIHE